MKKKKCCIKKIGLWGLMQMCVFCAFAEEISIYGKVMNNKGEHLPFATIMMYNNQDSILQGTLSDSIGNYRINGDLKIGLYNLKVSYVGARDSIIPLNIEKGKTKYIQNIILNEHETLGMVVVTARKPIVKQYADRIEVAVNNDILNTGSSALDALQRAPCVTIDRQGGNVKLMGKEVVILIDGRDSKIAVGDLLAMLETMSAENVATLDLITTPPAQYEAEGKGGAINIKMKHTENEGFNGSLSLSVGYSQFWKYREGVSMYYSKKKIALYGGVNYVNEKWCQKSNESFSWDTQNTNSSIARERNNPAFTYRTGIDYTINSKNSAGLTIDGYFKPSNIYIGNAGSEVFTQSQLDSLIRNEYSTPSSSDNIHSNIYYKHTFNEKSALNVTVDYLYDWFKEKGNYYGKTYGETHNLLSNWSLTNPSQAETNVWALRTDYYKKMRKAGQLEAGMKSSLVTIDYNGSYLFTQNDNQHSRNSIFDYAEQNHALYAAWSDKLGEKFSYKIGVRGEFTQTNADSKTTIGIIDTSYIELFPSAFLMYSLTDKHIFKLAYNKRITRPSYRALNPFEYYISQISVIAGSPNLFPSITHNIEFSHIYKNSLTTNLFYLYNKDVFSQILKRSETNPSTVIYFHDNIGASHEWGFFTGGYKQLLKWWGIYAQITAYYTYTDFLILGRPERKGLLQASTSISSQFFLPKEIKLELSGYGQTPEIAGFYERKAYYILNFNAAKTFGKEQNFTVSFKVNDLLKTDKRRSIGYSDGVTMAVKNSYDSRQFWVSALWKFGRNKNSTVKRQNFIEEEQKRM
ncbi:MAG: TonB-dependent receptor [Lentimicrobiaceae bacterium]|nr:TonB-dependent receptor [Lentimicrobiaceae bacterium]